MTKKVAINGFGRIGRNAFKIIFEQRDDIEVVAINDLFSAKQLAHLLKYDSTYGIWEHNVTADDENIIVDDRKVRLLAERDPAQLPWRDLGVDVVIESTGLFVDPAKAKAHIAAGAKKVLLSAPAKGEGAKTLLLGVNENELEPSFDQYDIFSNASCTTNCIAPVMKVLEDNFGIQKAFMNTTHSYTSDQRLLDTPHKDERRMRSAATNIIPTTTGASIAATEAIPALKGKFGGTSLRVPTPVVSIANITALVKRTTTTDEINDVFRRAAKEPYFEGILDATDEKLVSSDFIGNSHSSIVDLDSTAVVDGDLINVVSWYDNEWGYSNRLVEVTADIAKLIN
ncbi:MAG: type I glyceraldehyde-3-phosphate dehydrogenase [Candidatus Nanoperiomorbaceae bacterium]